MESVNKFQSLVILLMVAIGILLGQIGFVQTYSEYLITPFLMVMLFLVFLMSLVSVILMINMMKLGRMLSPKKGRLLSLKMANSV